MHFGTKSYLKSNHNHTAKQILIMDGLNPTITYKIRPICLKVYKSGISRYTNLVKNPNPNTVSLPCEFFSQPGRLLCVNILGKNRH